MDDIISLEHYKKFLDNLPYGVVISKIDGTFLYINNALCEILRLDKMRIMRKRTLDFYVNLKDREEIYRKLLEGEKVVNYRIDLKRGDGEKFPALVSVVDYVDEERKFSGFMVLVNDISDLYEKNKYRRLFAEIVKKTPHFVMVIDKNFKVKVVNDSLKKFLGKEEFIFEKLPFFKNIEKLKKSITNLSGDHNFFSNTEKFNYNGKELVFTYVVFPVFFDDEKFYVFILKDITYQMKLEEELAKKTRLEALERVVSNFIYQINEKISEALSLTMLAKNESDGKYLDKIFDKIDEISMLIDKASVFSRNKEISKDVFNPKEAVKQLIEEHKEIFSDNITVEIDGCDDCYLYVNEEIFKNAIFSMIINSLEAFENVEKEDKIINISLEKVERSGKSFVKIEIFDNACGIRNEDLPKVFEPFFSTKHDTDGHGLSLSVIYGFVKDNGGDIFVESEFGEYTKFIIFLPLYQS